MVVVGKDSDGAEVGSDDEGVGVAVGVDVAEAAAVVFAGVVVVGVADSISRDLIVELM